MSVFFFFYLVLDNTVKKIFIFINTHFFVLGYFSDYFIDEDKAFSFLKKAERLMKKKDFKMAEKLLIKSKKLFPMAQTNGNNN